MTRSGRVLLAAALFSSLGPGAGAAQQGSAAQGPEAGVREALTGHYAALQAGDVKAAASWLTNDYFYIAPWGALELRDENLGRYAEVFAAQRLKNYRVEVRALHTGSAGEDASWFRAIVREKYLRESGKKARNAFAEDLLTSGIVVRQDGRWKIRYLHQTWSDETLRQMVPILHAAQPVDPEEY